MEGDILQNEDFSPIIRNGDFAVGDNGLMQQKAVILAQKGEFREHPTLGVAVADFLEDDTTEGLGAAIREELEKDGWRIRKLKITDDFQTDIVAERR